MFSSGGVTCSMPPVTLITKYAHSIHAVMKRHSVLAYDLAVFH